MGILILKGQMTICPFCPYLTQLIANPILKQILQIINL